MKKTKISRKTMKLDEITIIKVTPPGKKLRKQNDFWAWEKRPLLKEAVEKCIATGEEQFVVDEYTSLYHVQRRYPFIPEAMARKENKDVLEVSVSVYHVAFHLAVRESK